MLVDETERSALLLGPEQPHEAGWFLLIDTGVNASAESIGFVDLVVRQGELWGHSVLAAGAAVQR